MNSLEEKVAELVRAYPHLYDRSSRDFRDGQICANAWCEIAVKVEEEPEYCKSVWRNLRDKFTKAKKRLLSKSGDGEKHQVPTLYKQLSWLNPFVQIRNTENCISYYNNNNNKPAIDSVEESYSIICKEEFDSSFPITHSEFPATQSPSCSSVEELESSTLFTTLPKRKRQRDSPEDSEFGQIFSELDKRRRLDSDVHDRYAQTIADFMRGLSRRHCAVFKKRVSDIMYETEIEQLDKAGL
ncbi:uncharacterized protein LOC134311730 [Trichomycterus rosablanca]|uniref:uncharacterized protein LOC134311730 n=1 Tax=Trichomycterus rosablanca TaxID=2290929 RepID=UPI002F357C43